MSNEVRLRNIEPNDLPIFYEQQLDADATRMAAFPSRDRAAFDALGEKHPRQPGDGHADDPPRLGDFSGTVLRILGQDGLGAEGRNPRPLPAGCGFFFDLFHQLVDAFLVSLGQAK